MSPVTTTFTRTSAKAAGVALAVLALLLLAAAPAAAKAKYKPKAFSTPTNSSPITMSRDGKLIWVVNSGGDDVAVVNAKTSKVIKHVKVGDEPQGVAVDPDNRFAYVANAAEGTVSVVKISNPNPNHFKAKQVKKFLTGAEPWNLVVSPNGKRVFVANSSQDTITVIDSTRRVNRKGKELGPRVIGGIVLRGSVCDPNPDLHFQPRGLAVTLSNKWLLVTSFFAFTRPGHRQVDDQGRQGLVCRIQMHTNAKKISGYRPSSLIPILPRDTGFPPIAKDAGLGPEPIFAWPNQMQSIVIRGNQAFLPNIAASPEGPQRFNNSTMAFVNVMDGVKSGIPSDGSGGRFLSLHLGARVPEPGKKKLFFANPWAIGFTSQSGAGEAYVVAAGSDLLVKVNVDGNGVLSFTGGPQTTRYIDLNDPANPITSGDGAGKNPQGIVVNAKGTKAWVNNFVSRNVSVVDLTQDKVVKTIRIAPLPAPGSPEEVVAAGAEIFFSSRGHFNRPPGTTVSTDERLSQDGWQSCSSCHFKGLTDSVVWAFGSGPRKSLPLNASFNPSDKNQQKILNYSAINDEIEDFEINIRNVSGPGPLAQATACSDPAAGQPATSTFDPNHGLIFGDNGDVNLPPCIVNQIPLKANADRNQFTLTLPGSNTAIPAHTALREWVRKAIRTPKGPFTNRGLPGRLDPTIVAQGKALFDAQGCGGCHGGTLFSNSVRDYVPPPAAGEVFTERTGTFTGNPVGAAFVAKFLVDIGSFNLGVAGQGNDLGSNIGAPEKAAAPFVNNATGAAQDGLGRDYNGDGKGNGFTIPSLLGIYNVPPYYHNGACETLDCVVGNAKHRTALGTLPDRLGNASDRAKVVAFLRSIH